MASSSGEILVANIPKGPITAYNLVSGVAVAHFSGTHCPRTGLALAGTGLIAAASSGLISLYNWWSPTPFHHIPLPETVGPVVATSDGSYLFCGCLSGYISALSLPSGHILRSFPAHHEPVSCLIINDDGSFLISGGDDGTVAVFVILQLLDLSSLENAERAPLYQLHAHDSSVTAIASGTGGCNSIMLSCSLDYTCKFWSLADGTHLRTVQFPCVIWCLSLDPTENEFYAGGSDGRVYVGMIKSGRREPDDSSARGVSALAPEHGGTVTAVVLANLGRDLVSASEDGSIRVWEVKTRTVVKVLGEAVGSIADLVVAKSVRGRGRTVADSIISCGESSGFSTREIGRPVKEVAEMEECLPVVVKDRRRAINMLETAISTYEKMLGLLLSQARNC